MSANDPAVFVLVIFVAVLANDPAVFVLVIFVAVLAMVALLVIFGVD